jgi:3-oxoacyl-[acyl-carrier-protein] synthase II
MSESIVFSGTGVVTAAGLSVAQNMLAMMNGESFMSPAQAWDPKGCHTDRYGEVLLTNDELRERIRGRLATDRLIPYERGELLFMVALEDALASAGLDLGSVDRSRVALLVGTSLSGFTNLERSWRSHHLEGAVLDRKSLLAYPLNVLVDRVACEFDLSGPRYLFSTACSASLHPVVWAEHLLDRDEVDIVLVGGADPLSLISMVGFSCLRSVAKLSSTPFSMGDPGVSIGEGAGVVVMERVGHFRARRGTPPPGFLSGSCGNSDAYHPTASDPMGTGIRRCLDESLQNVQVEAGTRAFVVAHGTGTMHNDKVESRAIQQIAALKGETKVTSLKSMIGHTLGASGAVELALLVRAMEEGVALPTANFGERRPGCDLDYVENKGIAFTADVGVKSALAFGGNNVTVALTRNEATTRRKPVLYDDQPIVVTGLGFLSGFGEIAERDLLLGLASGKTSIRDVEPAKAFNGETTSRRAAILDDVELAGMCERNRIKDYRKMDRLSRIATLAAQWCLKDSGFVVRQGNAYDIGLVSGTSTGHLESVGTFYTDFTMKGCEFADAGLFPNTVVNAHAGYITLQLRLKGYTTVVTQGNLSGAVALDLAVRALRAGTCSMMLAGATSEYSPNYHRALVETGLVHDSFVPYGTQSLGNCLGEGGAFLALERRSDAIARGARILATIDDVKLGFAPAAPSTFRARKNPLAPLLRGLAERKQPSSVLGDGSGFRPAARMETDALEKELPGVPVMSFSGALGCATGVNLLSSVAIACMARRNATDPSNAALEGGSRIEDFSRSIGDSPVCTCVAEGGAAGTVSMEFA